ncbi:hypothetical protein JAAARDRAFT_32365 [Jaapia argillacea MUCL 33604]|uniref:SH3 domain-containing protein n=1 Tax=Jaapia argillacea MUCL 33604 TaxID=933084 RepID=A0A067Q1I0_9AGAM|nr:hypothetical protein JAAARDRAFT_32365 [Jaapia argillacea MUCL 33604]
MRQVSTSIGLWVCLCLIVDPVFKAAGANLPPTPDSRFASAVTLPGSILSTVGPTMSDLPPPLSLTTPISTAPSTTSAAQSVTSASPSTTAAPVPTLAFHAIANMTACSPGIVNWDYAGPTGNLSFMVTNSFVPTVNDTFASPASPAVTRRNVGEGSLVKVKRQSGDIYEVVGSNLDPTKDTWTWPVVNVPQGWYVLDAFLSGIPTQSPAFFVSLGTNTSCLPASSLPSSSTTPASSSSVSPIPQSDASTNHHTGAIVGGVIGGLAFILAVLGALFVCRRRRRVTSRRGRSLSSSGYHFGGGWNGLKLNDNAPAPISRPRPSPKAEAEGFGPISSGTSRPEHGPDSELATAGHSGGGHEASSRNTSLSEFHSFDSDEKVQPPNEPGTMPLDNMQPLPYDPNTKRSSESSVVTRTASSSRTRTPSNATHTAAGLSKHDSTSSSRSRRRPSMEKRVPVPPYSPSTPNSTPPTMDTKLRTSADDFSHNYPPSHANNPNTPEAIPLTRSGSTGARRTPRKPVPKYSISDFKDGDIISNSPPTSPGIAHPSLGLGRRSSVGEPKGVHYIIPDMPPSRS